MLEFRHHPLQMKIIFLPCAELCSGAGFVSHKNKNSNSLSAYLFSGTDF